MITPSKYTTLDQSIMFKMLSLLKERRSTVSVQDLYAEHSQDYDAIDEFLLCLDALYVLNKIDINFDTGEVVYAD